MIWSRVARLGARRRQSIRQERALLSVSPLDYPLLNFDQPHDKQLQTSRDSGNATELEPPGTKVTFTQLRANAVNRIRPNSSISFHVLSVIFLQYRFNDQPTGFRPRHTPFCLQMIDVS